VDAGFYAATFRLGEKAKRAGPRRTSCDVRFLDAEAYGALPLQPVAIPAGPSSQKRQRQMEPLWSPVVATGGNRWQIRSEQTRPKQAKTVAVGCDGKEGVDGSSPSEGFSFLPA
jgi:hypothetical protein